MILKHQIITDIRIESVNDLYKLKPFLEDGTLKINKSQIARELEVDRRTVDKYINGYTKSETRNCDDVLHLFMTLLQSCYQIKISRYSTTEKYYGNIWLIIMALKVFIVTSVIISGNILNSIHISEKADHQIPIRLLSDMKHLWADRLSLIGKNLFRLFFLQVKL